MRKIAIVFSLVCLTIPALAEGEISVLFSELKDNAKICDELPSQIDKIKLSAGIGIGTGAVGTVGGATAAVTGVMKSKQDKKAGEVRALLAMNKDDFGKAVDDGRVGKFFEDLKAPKGSDANREAL